MFNSVKRFQLPWIIFHVLLIIILYFNNNNMIIMI
jgi:hypothetical protein